MTDEEKRAMEITNDLDTMVYDGEGSCVNIYDNIERAVLVGIRAGKPKWHDLRKNPEDLPKSKIYVLGFNYKHNRYEVCCTEVDHNGESYWHDISYNFFEPIAWCELPEFEE